MDNRRLDTAAVLGMGILSKPAPDTDIPQDRERVQTDDIGISAIAETIEAGKIVHSSNYYGIPFIWKEDVKYRIILLQYCCVTENLTFNDASEAVDKFVELHYDTDG